jgi:hypothetical protein
LQIFLLELRIGLDLLSESLSLFPEILHPIPDIDIHQAVLRFSERSLQRCSNSLPFSVLPFLESWAMFLFELGLELDKPCSLLLEPEMKSPLCHHPTLQQALQEHCNKRCVSNTAATSAVLASNTATSAARRARFLFACPRSLLSTASMSAAPTGTDPLQIVTTPRQSSQDLLIHHMTYIAHRSSFLSWSSSSSNGTTCSRKTFLCSFPQKKITSPLILMIAKCRCKDEGGRRGGPDITLCHAISLTRGSYTRRNISEELCVCCNMYSIH